MRAKLLLALSFFFVAAAIGCASRTIEEPLRRDTMKTEIDGGPSADDEADASDGDASETDAGCVSATRAGDC